MCTNMAEIISVTSRENDLLSYREVWPPSLILMAAEGWEEKESSAKGGGRQSMIRRGVGVGE